MSATPAGTNENWEGSFGLAGTDSRVLAMTRIGEELYIGGEFRAISGAPYGSVARWDGHHWQQLGRGLLDGVDGSVHSITRYGEKIVIGGQFSRAGGVEARNIALYDPATDTFSPLGKGIGGIQASNVLALASDGTDLYAAGRFVVAGTTVAVNIAHWDGEGWHRVGTGINDNVRVLAIDRGYLYAGGNFTIAGDTATSRLARFDLASQRWSAMGNGKMEIGEVVAALAFDNRYCYVGGSFREINGKVMNNIARYDLASGEWSDLRLGVDNARKTRPGSLAIDQDGIGPTVIMALAIRGEDLFAGGDFDDILSDDTDPFDVTEAPRDMAKWNRTTETWSKLPRVSLATGIPYQSVGVMKGTQTIGTGSDFVDYKPRDLQATTVNVFLPGNGDALYIGGYFDFAGPLAVSPDAGVGGSQFNVDPEAVFASNICQLSERDTLWTAIGSEGLDDSIFAMVDDGQSIYAGGRFYRAGSEVVRGIASYDKSEGAWHTMGEGVTGGVVRAIADQGNSVVIGGDFTSVDGTPSGGIAIWDKSSQSWSRPGNQTFGRINDVEVDGSTIIAVGNQGLALWNGSTWDIVPERPDGPIFAAEVSGDSIFVGGKFSSIGDTSASNIAWWSRSTRTWHPLKQGVNDTVYALEIWNGDLFVGGNFYNAGGRFVYDFASWDIDVGLWDAPGNGLQNFGGTDGRIFVMHASKYGLYVGGQFLASGESPVTNRALNIILWDGSRWNCLGNGVQKILARASVHALASDSVRLHVGGLFHVAGAKSANRFADWRFPDEKSGGVPVPDENSDATEIRGNIRGVRDPRHPSILASVRPGDEYWDDRFSPQITPPGTNDEVFAMVSDSLRNVYVGGTFTRVVGLDVHSIAAWNGTDWELLNGPNGEGVDGFVFALKLAGDSLWVGGQFDRAGEIEAHNIAIWNRRTRTWHAVGKGVTNAGEGTPFVSSIVITSNGVYVGGNFGTAGSMTANNVALWNGADWSGLGSGVNGIVNDLEFFGGYLVAGGRFGTAGSITANGIAWWDGGAWHAIREGVNGAVNALEIYHNQLLVGGQFNVNVCLNPPACTSLIPQQNLVAINSDLTDFLIFRQQTSQITEIRDLLTDGTRVYVAGSYSFQPDPTAQVLAPHMINNVGFNFRESVDSGWAAWLDMNHGTDGPVNVLAKVGDDIFVGGSFTESDDRSTLNIARWNSRFKYWRPLVSASTLGNLSALALHRGQIFAAGAFTEKGDPTQTLDNDNHLARLGTTGWHLVEGTIRGDAFTAMASDSEIVVGGQFFTTDGKIGVNLSRWDPATETWNSLSPGSGVADQEEDAYVNTLLSVGENLYVGGRFGVVDTFETPNIALLNRTTGIWEAIGNGLNESVWALAADGSGTIYAGGDFTRSGTTVVNGVARWNGTEWEPLGTGIIGKVRSLAIGNGKLYVGGTFTNAGGVAAENVAAYNLSSGLWEPVGSGLHSTFLPSVESLLFVRGRLFAGGFFQTSGKDSVMNVARLEGDRWVNLGSGTDHAVWSLVVDRNDLYVAGAFRSTGGFSSPYIGLWHDPTLTVAGDVVKPAPELLLSAEPNPISSRTVLRYYLPDPSDVQITISDVTGRTIHLVDNEPAASGYHLFEWKPDGGLANGLYYCSIRTSYGSAVTPLLLYR